MKYIKLFESFFAKRNPNYKKPEYEFKEFYRGFKKCMELRSLLPSDIDQEIFDVVEDGFGGEPKWLEHHVDPPSRPEEITTEELIKIAEQRDPRFIPFILWCRELFECGKMEKMTLDYIRPRLRSNFKNHDWDALEKNPDYLDKCQNEYNKAIEAGLDDDTLENTLGLVQKYPDITINMAQFWVYVKGSIAHFNRVEESGGQLPCTQFILYRGKYYTVGGRRRMFWHFYNHIDPTVWVIEADV
ncbi:MAG: hypothetical protein EBS19_03350 [Spirochaetia bacterium]|nr:hypothetical protein [Spirochaetia bacterium]